MKCNIDAEYQYLIEPFNLHLLSLHLYIVRHAQATDTQTRQQDFDRELTSQGQRDAIGIGNHLKKLNTPIDFIISSKAKRAELTSALIAEQIGFPMSQIQWDEEIYQASARILLKSIHLIENNFKHIIIVGHNPYISYLAEYLSKSEIGDMKSGSLVCIKFDITHWNELAEGNGSLEYYYLPPID